MLTLGETTLVSTIQLQTPEVATIEVPWHQLTSTLLVMSLPLAEATLEELLMLELRATP